MVPPQTLPDILRTYSLSDCQKLFEQVKREDFDRSKLPDALQKYHQATLWRCLAERINTGFDGVCLF